MFSIKEQPFFTIVSPVYNVEKYIQKFIQSVMKQFFSDFEVIFVNDGSTDDSKKIIEKSIEKDNRFKLINIKNSGSGKARNTGLEFAQGKYIYFADPDDFLDEKLLLNNFQNIKNYQPDFVMFGYNQVDNLNNVIKVNTVNQNLFLRSRKEFLEKFDYLQVNNNINTVWNKIYNINFLRTNEINFPYNKTGQDALFNYKVFKKVNTVYVDNGVYYNYLSFRQGSAQNSNKEKYKDEYEIFKTKKAFFLENFSCKEAEYLVMRSCLDFLTAQVIAFKGYIPIGILKSQEFVEVDSYLKSNYLKVKSNVKLTFKSTLLRLKRYRICFFVLKNKYY